MPLTVDGAEPVADSEVRAELGPSMEEGTREEFSEDDSNSATQSERAGRPNFLTSTRFSDLSLPPEIMGGLDAAGFELCTPIQAQVIPVALEGKDIAGQAQTGTGKTTAFLVPLLTRLIRKAPSLVGLPRALVVTPTRELAQQIYKEAMILASLTPLTSALIMGGMEYREQAAALEAGPDIVICTPGRILDYLQQGVFDPRAVEVTVVDEADRLLDMGFIKDLKKLLSKLPPYSHRQTMLFSATLDDRVLELTYQFMSPPQYITAEPDPASKAQIDQTLYHVSLQEKLPLLLGLLRGEDHHRVLIFCNTKSSVEWLTKKLVLNKFQAEGITGDLAQTKRLKLMQDFKEKRLQIMVATDVASRGIHVEDVSHVYNYDLPQDAESYIHRIGRTARAGKTGQAISFACEDHVFHLEAIENILGAKIPVKFVDDTMFSQDVAGDVKVKERPSRKGRFADRPSDRPAERRSEGGGGGGSRGPAKSSRPGGIFGLSPRHPVTETNPDKRQVLSWTPDSLDKPPRPSEAELELKDKKPLEAREGRRRKRRRGKRDDAQAPLSEAAATGAEADGPPLETLEKSGSDKPSAEKTAAGSTLETRVAVDLSWSLPKDALEPKPLPLSATKESEAESETVGEVPEKPIEEKAVAISQEEPPTLSEGHLGDPEVGLAPTSIPATSIDDPREGALATSEPPAKPAKKPRAKKAHEGAKPEGVKLDSSKPDGSKPDGSKPGKPARQGAKKPKAPSAPKPKTPTEPLASSESLAGFEPDSLSPAAQNLESIDVKAPEPKPAKKPRAPRAKPKRDGLISFASLAFNKEAETPAESQTETQATLEPGLVGLVPPSQPSEVPAPAETKRPSRPRGRKKTAPPAEF
ncbi:MAG: DEAD/DEAH box helicase [Deltaproteobacteria bacterium]|jgi:ATP-dependent RNA helicase RhlB|nr:DEAD/DEAH box helicase [Deltaproteobacteria bacterium]